MTCHSYSKCDMAQLVQLWVPTWDGDLCSKASRDALVRGSLAQRAHGYNWLTADGLIMVRQWSKLADVSEPIRIEALTAALLEYQK